MQSIPKNILIIKHGSLGDWIQATGAFKLIRARYPKSHITILTQSNYAPLAYKCTWFNEVWIDDRLPLYKFFSNIKIIKKLRNYDYDHVYDLQCSNRTNIYHFLIRDKIKNWYGRARGCSHYVPFNHYAHSTELSYDLIKASGINNFPIPDISWLKTNKPNKRINSLKNFVLFIPGCSAKHIKKRWIAKNYAKLIDCLAKKNFKSILTGTEIDRQIINEIIENCSTSPINLINQAGFAEMAELARNSQLVIGGDTGPTHIAATTTARTLILFTGASDPKKSRPWGNNITVLNSNSPETLSVEKVLDKTMELLNT